MTVSARDRLIETALDLFNRAGYHATGIDRILAEAGVAKMTLYKQFGSKEELILAALRERDARWRAGFRAALERRAAAPRERLLAVFDALDDWFAEPGFSGCMFINAAAEYPEQANPIHAAAADHHRHVLADLRALAAEAGARRPAQLAREIMLLMEGAIAVTQVNGPVGAAQAARRAAKVLIANALEDAAALPVGRPT